LGVLLVCVWFLTLDARHLLRSDEGRYAQIALEMLSSGDWVTIRYHGLKYFEKPPFHLWATALSFWAFGVGEWQARLWVALSGAVAMALTAVAAQRWYGRRVGLLAALALLAAPTWNIGAHFNSLDMSVSAALTAVLMAVLMAQHPQTTPGSRRRWMWAAWAAMGVAVLTKGLIGIVLPGLVLVVYTLLARDWALWRRLHIGTGTVVFLVITVPWFWVMQVRNPEFAHFFFIHEHFARYTSTVHSRSAPWWYFVPQLAAGFAPWLGLLARMAVAVREGARGEGFKPTVLLAAWAGAIFVFFSASGSKLPGYILPVFPALAVLAAIALDGMDSAAWRRQWRGLLVLALLGVAASLLVGRVGSGEPGLLDYGKWLTAACLLIAAGLLLAAWLNQRGRLLPSMVTAAVAFFVGTTVGLLGHETLGRRSSGADLVPQIQAVLTPQMPIYGVRLLDHTLPFYLRRTLIMVEEPDELEFGTEQQPHKWLPTMAAFRQAWTAGPPALALMAPATYATLSGENLPMHLIAKDARRVVVANFANAQMRAP
jgi:4-amino-4-deoxy-L-arabinose transferase-like glycosyltransferase